MKPDLHGLMSWLRQVNEAANKRADELDPSRSRHDGIIGKLESIAEASRLGMYEAEAMITETTGK